MNLRAVCLSLLLASLPAHADPVASQPLPATTADRVYALDASLWARPRSGEAVAGLAPVREAVQELLGRPGSRLAIRYPGGEEGGLWAQELRDWLVALGVEPELLLMQPGLGRDDLIELQVVKPLN